MNKELIEKLKKLARKETCTDNWNEVDFPPYHCGNSDDTYNMGVEDGQIELARDILNEFKIDYA